MKPVKHRIIICLGLALSLWASADAKAAPPIRSCRAAFDITTTQRTKIADLPIKFRHKQKLGSHGAYRAELKDGTLVLVKPHHDDWFSSIPKEVGLSIYADLIGLPIVPPATYGIDPYTQLPASIHLYLPNAKSRGSLPQIWSGIKALTIGRNDEMTYLGDKYGTDVHFLMTAVSYSEYEISERHVLRENVWSKTQGQLPSRVQKKYLIDLGSAFLEGRFNFPELNQVASIRVPESTLKTIENLKLDDFTKELAPYMPSDTIRALFNRTKLLGRVLRTLDPATGKVDEKRYTEIRQEYIFNSSFDNVNGSYIPQKWSWTESAEPPQIALDHDL